MVASAWAGSCSVKVNGPVPALAAKVKLTVSPAQTVVAVSGVTEKSGNPFTRTVVLKVVVHPVPAVAVTSKGTRPAGNPVASKVTVVPLRLTAAGVPTGRAKVSPASPPSVKVIDSSIHTLLPVVGVSVAVGRSTTVMVVWPVAVQPLSSVTVILTT